MNTIKYVKAVHGLTTEEFGDAQILTPDDVDQILARKLQMLNSTVNRLEQESRENRKRVEVLEQNRKWLWENIDLIKKFLVGEVEKANEKMLKYTADNHNVLGGLEQAWNTKCRLDKLPDSCREIFGNVIKVCLRPSLDTFGRQITNLESQYGREYGKRIEELEENRKVMLEYIDIIRRLLVGNVDQAKERMQNYATKNHNILDDLDLMRDAKCRLDKFQESSREVFEAMIKESVEPRLMMLDSAVMTLMSQISRVRDASELVMTDDSKRRTCDATAKDSWFSRMMSWFKTKNSHTEVSEGA